MSRRMHIHINVDDVDRNIAFYSTLFAQEPDVRKDDYAKWLLADPAVNFAISNRCGTPGIDHLGIQVGSDAEVETIESRLQAATEVAAPQRDARCCYANGNKTWSQDPSGVPWEVFHTLSDIPVFGSDDSALDDVKDESVAMQPTGGVCCG